MCHPGKLTLLHDSKKAVDLYKEMLILRWGNNSHLLNTLLTAQFLIKEIFISIFKNKD